VNVPAANLARGLPPFISTQGPPKEFAHPGIELLVERLAIEVRRLPADVVCAGSQLVGTRWQERKVPGVWDRMKIRLDRQFVRDGYHALGRHPVATVLGAPELDWNAHLVERSLREEDAPLADDATRDQPLRRCETMRAL